MAWMGTEVKLQRFRTLLIPQAFWPDGEKPHLGRVGLQRVDRVEKTHRVELAHAVALKGHVVRGFDVVGTGGREGKAHRHAGFAAAVVEGQLLALDVEGELLRAAANFLGGAFDPLGQHIAQPAAA